MKEGDFVYLDPPYYSDRDGMIDYGSDVRSKEGQRKLRDFLLRLHEKGVLFMFSNYAHPFITKDLYSDTNVFNTEIIMVERTLKIRKKLKDGTVKVKSKKVKEEEVIITNYHTKQQN